MASPLRIERRGAVALLTLARPDARNALNAPLRDALRAALDDARENGRVRALVLAGDGPAFCAGLDLAELEGLTERTPAQHRADSDRLADLFASIYRFPKPTVAAVRGAAVAGGAGLATVCDLVIAGDDASFTYSEARIGFVAALVGVFLTRQVGERHARDLLLSARRVSAFEAHRIGLVTEIASSDEVLEHALDRAEALAENAPSSLAATKALLARVGGPDLDEALAFASELNARSRSSDDLAEGIRAFFEKRPPTWRS